MRKKLIGIRQVLALNLKKNRQKCGLTQEKLAEKAGISAHYLAMVEVAKKFPTPEMLDKLAQALKIDTVQLFDVSATPEGALLHLEQSIVQNLETIIKKTNQDFIGKINQTVHKAINEALSEKCSNKKKR